MSAGVGTRSTSAVGHWLAWLAVAPLAVWALVRVTGLELGHPWVQVLAFTPYAAAAALLLVGALLGARQWAPATGAGLALLILAACVVPRGLGSPTDQAGPTLTVMSMNMWGGAADPHQIVGLVRDRRVDVLAVQEFTPDAQLALADAGLSELLPFGQLDPRPGAGGSALYSRHPLRDGTASVNPGGFLQSSAVLQIAGAEPARVVSVHPVPPNSAGWVPLWSAGVRGQPSAERGLVLAGDFNATLDHAQLRLLLETGYIDAAAAVGAGLTPTWPYAGDHAWQLPKVTIDHILAGPGIGVRDFTATTVAVTDHRAIIATLILPAQRSAMSTTIGAWSEGPLPLRASRSITACSTRSARPSVA